MLALTAPIPDARAEGDPAKEAAAKQHFKSGRALFNDGKYEAALAEFEKVYEATESPNAHLLIARCHRELGDLPEAYDHMRATIREAESAEDKARYAATHEAATAELKELAEQVGLVTVTLSGQPDGATVTVAERPVPVADLKDPVAVKPGAVTVQAGAPGTDPVMARLTIEAGETKTVELALSAQSAPTPPEDDSEGVEDEGTGSPGTLQTAGLVGLGIGAAGLITFAITGSMAQSKYHELESECGDYRCTDPSLQDTVDSGRTLETVANVGLIVGAVGIVAGTTLLVMGQSSDATADSAKSRPGRGFAFGVGPEGGSLSYSGSF
jgi:hypothetical protein